MKLKITILAALTIICGFASFLPSSPSFQLQIPQMAEAAPPTPAPSVIPSSLPEIQAPTSEEIKATLESIPKLFQHPGTAMIVLIIVQLLMLIFKLPVFDGLLGIWKLLVVQFLTIVIGYVAFWVQGVAWTTAAFDPVLLGFLQVFGHQIYTQVKKGST